MKSETVARSAEERSTEVWKAVLTYIFAVRKAWERWPEINRNRLPDRFERIEWAKEELSRKRSRGTAIGMAKAKLFRELGRIFQEDLSPSGE